MYNAATQKKGKNSATKPKAFTTNKRKIENTIETKNSDSNPVPSKKVKSITLADECKNYILNASKNFKCMMQKLDSIIPDLQSLNEMKTEKITANSLQSILNSYLKISKALVQLDLDATAFKTANINLQEMLSTLVGDYQISRQEQIIRSLKRIENDDSVNLLISKVKKEIEQCNERIEKLTLLNGNFIATLKSAEKPKFPILEEKLDNSTDNNLSLDFKDEVTVEVTVKENINNTSKQAVEKTNLFSNKTPLNNNSVNHCNFFELKPLLYHDEIGMDFDNLSYTNYTREPKSPVKHDFSYSPINSPCKQRSFSFFDSPQKYKSGISHLDPSEELCLFKNGLSKEELIFKRKNSSYNDETNEYEDSFIPREQSFFF